MTGRTRAEVHWKTKKLNNQGGAKLLRTGRKGQEDGRRKEENKADCKENREENRGVNRGVNENRVKKKL